MKRAMTALIMVVVATPALAETHKPDEKVAGHPGLTYAMLLKQALPDLAKAGDTWKARAVRNHGQLLGEPGQPAPVTLTDVDVERIHEAGQSRLLLLTSDSNNPAIALLAAFDEATAPRLMDFAYVPGPGTHLAPDPPNVVPLGDGNDTVILDSAQDNSPLYPHRRSGIVLRGGKLTPVFTLRTTEWHSCTLHHDQAPSFAAANGALTVSVLDTENPETDDCNDLPGAKQFTIKDTWHWDAKKNAYVPATGALDRYSAENSREN